MSDDPVQQAKEGLLSGVSQFHKERDTLRDIEGLKKSLFDMADTNQRANNGRKITITPERRLVSADSFVKRTSGTRAVG